MKKQFLFSTIFLFLFALSLSGHETDSLFYKRIQENVDKVSTDFNHQKQDIKKESQPRTFWKVTDGEAINYVTYKQRPTNFTTAYSWGDFQSTQSIFRTIEFSANLFKSIQLGGFLGLSNEQKNTANFALSLGYKSMGVSLEKGNLTGIISTTKHNDLKDLEPTIDINSEFSTFKIYKYWLVLQLNLVCNTALMLYLQILQYHTKVFITVGMKILITLIQRQLLNFMAFLFQPTYSQ